MNSNESSDNQLTDESRDKQIQKFNIYSIYLVFFNAMHIIIRNMLFILFRSVRAYFISYQYIHL